MEPFKFNIEGSKSYSEYSVQQSIVLEESPTCRLLESIHNTNLNGILTAIADGARLFIGKQNALEYAIGKIRQESKREQALEICLYLIQSHSEVVTEKCLNKILKIDDKDAIKRMIQVLGTANEPLCKQLFTETCTNGWAFPIARVYTYVWKMGHLDELYKYVRYKPPHPTGPCGVYESGYCTCGGMDAAEEHSYEGDMENQPPERKAFGYYSREARMAIIDGSYFNNHGFAKVLPAETEINQEMFEIYRSITHLL